MERYYVQGADGKFFEPGRHKRNYVDADGTQYTVRIMWIDGIGFYRVHEQVDGCCRVTPFTHWFQTEQEAQEELDIEASAQGWPEWKEEEQ